MDKKILNKIKLLMFYDNSKPLNEQKTYPVVPSNISNFKTDFDKDKMVYDPNITTTSKEYDKNGNIITKEKKLVYSSSNLLQDIIFSYSNLLQYIFFIISVSLSSILIPISPIISSHTAQ